MPTRTIFLNPVVKMTTDIDTGIPTIELDWGGSLDKTTDEYRQLPDECEADAEWLDRAMSVRGTFAPTSVGGIIRLLPGEVPEPVNLEDLPPPPYKGGKR